MVILEGVIELVLCRIIIICPLLATKSEVMGFLDSENTFIILIFIESLIVVLY